MLGNPKFKVGDKVVFNIVREHGQEVELTGTVYIVDKYGIFFDDSSVYYDIMTEISGDMVLIKHIKECNVTEAKE